MARLPYKFAYSSDISKEFFVKVECLNGQPFSFGLGDSVWSPMLYAQIYSQGRPISMLTRTSTPASWSGNNPRSFTWKSEKLTFTTCVCDLPHDAVLAFTIFDMSKDTYADKILGSCTIPIFTPLSAPNSKNSQESPKVFHIMKQSTVHNLQIYLETQADEHGRETDGLAYLKDPLLKKKIGEDFFIKRELYELNQKNLIYENPVAKIGEPIENIVKSEILNDLEKSLMALDFPFLTITFPDVFDEQTNGSKMFINDVLFYDKHDMAPKEEPSAQVLINQVSKLQVWDPALVKLAESGKIEEIIKKESYGDRALGKPNREREIMLDDFLSKIMKGEGIDHHQRDLLYIYRYWIQESRKDKIIEFFRAICATYPIDTKTPEDVDKMQCESLKLLENWGIIDITSTLLLLSPDFPTMKQPQVAPTTKNRQPVTVSTTQSLSDTGIHARGQLRKFAVWVLSEVINDTDLELYLLQLVHAIQFEHQDDVLQKYQSLFPVARKTSISNVPGVDDIAPLDPLPTNPMSESSSSSYIDSTIKLTSSQTSNNPPGPTSQTSVHSKNSLQTSISSSSEPTDASRRELKEDLASFLVQRCAKDRVLAFRFFWHVYVEENCMADKLTKERKTSENRPLHVILRDLANYIDSPPEDFECPFNPYTYVRQIFSRHLRKAAETEKSSNESTPLADELSAQIRFVAKIAKLSNELPKLPDKAAKKARLQEYCLGELNSFLVEHGPIRLPTNVKYLMHEVAVDVHGKPEVTLFSSAMAPFKISFAILNPDTSDPEDAKKAFIFKSGDNLIRDELIMQLMRTMERFIPKTATGEPQFDMKLTLYSIVATSDRTGFLEYIPSKCVKDVPDIPKYLESISSQRSTNVVSINSQDSVTKTRISDAVLENFIQSNAGYCVAMYLLAIGDRHLHNILMKPDGLLFHIDFGYIFGEEAKILQGPIKLTKEICQVIRSPCPGAESRWPQFLSTFKGALKYMKHNEKIVLTLIELMKEGSWEVPMVPENGIALVTRRFRATEDFTVKQLENAEHHFFNKLADVAHTVAMTIK